MPTVKLTPLGLGEMLDQTFSTFRKHFWLFAGIMVVPQGVVAVLNIIIQVALHPVFYLQPQKNPAAAAQAAESTMRAGLAGIAIAIPYFVLYTLALGAATHALSEIYLGRATTIRASYRAVRRKFWKLLNVIISVFIRVFGIFMLAGVVGGVLVASLTVVGVFKTMPWLIFVVAAMAILGAIAGGLLLIVFVMRYSVAVPALVLEKINASQAIKRSVLLTKGYLWRLLIVLVLMYLISMTIVSICQAPFTAAIFYVAIKGGQPSLWLTIPNVLMASAASIATTPLFLISFAIAYYDLRVRKEGFDLQLMMEQLDGPAPAGAKRFDDESGLPETSVFFAVIATIVTGGIYVPIWFLRRRKALNELHSREKVGLPGLLIALLGFVCNLCIPLVGKFVWGSSVQAENNLGPLHPSIVLIAQIIIVVECFKVRRILLDHLAPQQEGMFSASIRFQYDDMLSRMGTFFLGIYIFNTRSTAWWSGLRRPPRRPARRFHWPRLNFFRPR